ncbi:MAG TPA: hypothetical protein VFP88_04655 [Rhodanobacteraceae bacterium]|nr:hypothetical protein [Rhodanobacteraceae bacterium]
MEAVSASLRTLARVRDLCLFRAGPQDLPYSPRAVIALLIVGAVLEAFFDTYEGSGIAVIVAANLGTLAALAALRTMLRWRGKLERFVQTSLALLASGLICELIVLPLVLYFGHPTDPAAIAGPQLLAGVVAMVLLLWQTCISVRILRTALNLPLPGALLALFALGFVDIIATALFAGTLGAV